MDPPWADFEHFDSGPPKREPLIVARYCVRVWMQAEHQVPPRGRMIFTPCSICAAFAVHNNPHGAVHCNVWGFNLPQG